DHRPARVAGHPTVDGEAAQRASHDHRAGALSWRLRRGGGGSSARPSRAWLHDPSAPDAEPDPRSRQKGGSGAGSGEPARTHRIRPPSLRYHPGDDGEPRIRRPGLPAGNAAQDPALASDLRGTWTQSGNRNRWRGEHDDGGAGGGGRGHGDRRGLRDFWGTGLRGGDRLYSRRGHGGDTPLMSATASKSGNDRDAFKRAAAEEAAKLVEDGMVVGLGTGSTA